MEPKITNSLKFFLLFLLLFFFISTNVYLCSAVDTISSGQSISSNQTLISKDGNFALGFFRPGSSPNCYLGIWYNRISLQNKTYIWVANRDDPLTDLSSSELKLLENGNLVLLNQSKIPIWSTNSSSNTLNSSELVIGDDGNLVLRERSESSVVLWQSFDHPTDTFLPGGKLRYDNITKTPVFLTSWKTVEDPSKGIYSLQLDPIEKQYSIYRNDHNKSYWVSGSWNGEKFNLVPEMRRDYIFNYSYVEEEKESYFTYSLYDNDKSIMSRLVLDLSGQIKQLTWLDSSQQWNLFWSQPRQQCEVYAFCGTFGSCNQRGLPFCQCLQGFQPRSSRDWYNLSDYSGGCVREPSLQCWEKAGFFLLSNVKVPQNALSVPFIDAEGCKLACLKNCSCTAYSFHTECSIWIGDDLLNLQQLYISDSDSNGRDLYVRFADHKEKKKVMKIIIITVIFGVVTIGVLTYISLRWMAKRSEKKKKKKDIEILLDKSGNISEFRDNQELPFFNLKKLATATNNFDAANKLGQGGFGPVYKGKLPNRREIAVKRLSRSSGQGIEEFKNEVVLISKLQHRNLVRLLGYCMEGEERMLIYEYMPNKSLDAFIFDPTKRVLLDWRKRFEIIMGICRGIIYLHRDSRLRVIHRDLKASNILLDQELNPKISDFGMARIFGGDELQANTMRVVGTYGYMSPEYAMEGLFSEKSDVFSFGVLLLEIVSGKRNTSFYHHKQSWSLLGYAWKLWNEGEIQELIDPVTSESSFQEEILRCIHVGLLCVQDFAKDRPTMSSIVSMLLSEITSLPTPKQPAFTGGRVESDFDLCQDTIFSNNNVSITVIGGR